jgi:hypothetical protein
MSVESVPVTPDAATRLRNHPDLTATSFHEAGHAVAAVRHDLTLESVDVVYTPDRFGAADYKHEHAPLETRAVCLLAAGAAERRYTGSRRAHDAGDVDALRVLFRGSALDPDRPYAEQSPGADAERQRIVDGWYAKAEAFVEREWMWIERVAQALQRRERLTGAEAKKLCFHPVVHLDPPPTANEDASRAVLPTPTRAPDPALMMKTSDAPAPADGAHDVVYDTKRFEEAHGRFLKDAKALTDDDLAQFALVSPKFAERARAKRAGFVEAEDAAQQKIGKVPLPYKDFIKWIGDYLGPILATHRYKSRQTEARCEALELRVVTLESELVQRVKALEVRPKLYYAGIWKSGERYTEGSLLTHAGSLWLAEQTTSGTPGTPASGFRLIVKNGNGVAR